MFDPLMKLEQIITDQDEVKVLRNLPLTDSGYSIYIHLSGNPQEFSLAGV
jgi:hypothetical protein